MILRKLQLSCALALCTAGLISCDDDTRDADRLAALNSEIRALVGDATCGDIADCRFIAYGAKPCGGPWEYLIYCVSAVDSAKLDSLVALHFALEQKLNEKEGRISDCMAVGPPAVGLVGGKCSDTSVNLSP